MANRAHKVKIAALIKPRVSFAGVKFSSVVAIVPMKTALLSHFCQKQVEVPVSLSALMFHVKGL